MLEEDAPKNQPNNDNNNEDDNDEFGPVAKKTKTAHFVLSDDEEDLANSLGPHIRETSNLDSDGDNGDKEGENNIDDNPTDNNMNDNHEEDEDEKDEDEENSENEDEEDENENTADADGNHKDLFNNNGVRCLLYILDFLTFFPDERWRFLLQKK